MKTPYQLLGDDGIRRLAEAFYQIMDEAHEAVGIRRMHSEDLGEITEKLYEYLVGWMGGPPLYAKKYGTVCLTKPHEPYAIGPDERDQWLLCMDRALERIGASDEVKKMLEEPMKRIARAVQNRDRSPAKRLAEDDNLIAVG